MMLGRNSENKNQDNGSEDQPIINDLDPDDAFDIFDSEDEDMSFGYPDTDEAEESIFNNFFAELKDMPSFLNDIIRSEKLKELAFKNFQQILELAYNGWVLMKLMRRLNGKHNSVPTLNYWESIMAARVLLQICASAVNAQKRFPAQSYQDFKQSLTR